MLTGTGGQQKTMKGWRCSHLFQVRSLWALLWAADRSSHGSWSRTEPGLKDMAPAEWSRVCGQPPTRLGLSDQTLGKPLPTLHGADDRLTGIIVAQQTRTLRTISDLSPSTLCSQTSHSVGWHFCQTYCISLGPPEK